MCQVKCEQLQIVLFILTEPPLPYRPQQRPEDSGPVVVNLWVVAFPANLYLQKY